MRLCRPTLCDARAAIDPARNEVRTLSRPATLFRGIRSSTTIPRPVTLSYGNVLANALGCFAVMGLDRAERWLCPLPLSHVGGLMTLLRQALRTAVFTASGSGTYSNVVAEASPFL